MLVRAGYFPLPHRLPFSFTWPPSASTELTMTTSIQADIPDRLAQQAAILIRDGWASDLDEILTKALRRYLSSHSAELSETFVHEDLHWGLRGDG